MTQSPDPAKVSIIVPTFNRSTLVVRALTSIERQSYNDFEVLVIDDCSSDDTEPVVRQVMARDRRIKYHRLTSNVGCGEARNYGIRHAEGEYIAFLDSDDEWLPEKLDEQIKSIEKSGESSFFSTSKFYLDNGNRIKSLPKRGLGANESLHEYLFCTHGSIQTSTVIVPAKLARQALFPRTSHGEDFVFFDRILSAGARPVFVDKPLSKWHVDNRSDRLSLKCTYQETLDWVDIYRERLTPRAMRGYYATKVAPRLSRVGGLSGKCKAVFFILRAGICGDISGFLFLMFLAQVCLGETWFRRLQKLVAGKKLNGLSEQLTNALYRFSTPLRSQLTHHSSVLWGIVRKIAPGKIVLDPGIKSVILVANNRLNLKYLLQHLDILKIDASLRFFVTGPRSMRRSIEQEIKVKLLPVQFKSLAEATRSNWGLILFSGHYFGAFFDRQDPKIFIGHGIFSGKMTHDECYVYGHKSLAGGKSLYTRILASSTREKEHSLIVNAAAAKNVTVAGELVGDKLLEKNLKRDDIRKELGIEPDEKVILIVSSWGPHGLLEAYGQQVLSDAEGLGDGYRIFASCHIHNMRNKKSARLIESFSGGKISWIDPLSDWVPVLAAADLLISDHTSMSLYFSLLHRPIIFVPFSENVVDPSGIVIELYNLNAHFDCSTRLEEQIMRSLKDYSPAKVRNFTGRNFPCLGSFKENFRQECQASLATTWQKGTQ